MSCELYPRSQAPAWERTEAAICVPKLEFGNEGVASLPVFVPPRTLIIRSPFAPHPNANASLPMTTLLIAVAVFLGYFVAYHTYGRWLARKIFSLDPEAVVPSVELRDDVDYCPTKKAVIFGHHFTSIAGTGPIVGPAIAVFWGWLPALLWVLFGAIFFGAVHDFGALVVSLRNRGYTVGQIAGRMIAPRTKYLFLLILFFSLTLVLAIFGLVIASIFKLYPESVLSVWLAMPVAVLVGLWVYKLRGGILLPSLLALGLMYAAIYIGVYYCPIQLPQSWGNAIVIWTIILLIYCYIASVLPVWLLLQPRDFINSHQLLVALGLLVLGLVAAAFSNKIDLIGSAPAIAQEVPADAPPIFPFLFVTVACGAVSGFHCLVSSGTSSKQVASEPDAQLVGFGSMLMEGVLAVLVIIACCAGVGMGAFKRDVTKFERGVGYEHTVVLAADGEQLKGLDAWRERYNPEKSWFKDFGLGDKVGAFVDGGANIVAAVGVPLELAIGIIAVLVASFAATTLDTATRLHRYVIQELAAASRIKPLTNKYAATGLAVVLGGCLAMLPGPKGVVGTGGLILWPLFGATNQLLAGLAFLVTFFYLWRRGKPTWFIAVPAAVMLVMPISALCWQMFNSESGWFFSGAYLKSGIALATMGLQLWMIVEAVLAWSRAKGVLEEALPPLEAKPAAEAEPVLEGGRSR